MGGRLTRLSGILVWSCERGLVLIVAVLEAALRVFFDFRDGGMFLNDVETTSFSNECGILLCPSMQTNGVIQRL